MSGGTACRCEGPRTERMKRWYVMRRQVRCSAFDGYRTMCSDYSTVACPQCGSAWRTRARYVYLLPDEVAP